MTIDEPLNEFGYRGINATVSLGEGINGEVQVHTAESWALKKQTDPLYCRWRDEDEATLSAEQAAAFRADVERCWALWADYWGKVPADRKAAISEAVKGLASMTASQKRPTGRAQAPSTRTSTKDVSGLNRPIRPSSKRNISGAPISESTPPENAPVNQVRDALGELSYAALAEKARQIGVTVRGKKAQLAALIADAIKAKAGIAKRTRADRKALAETEAQIKQRRLCREMDRAGRYVDAHTEASLRSRTRRGRVDPDITYYADTGCDTGRVVGSGICTGGNPGTSTAPLSTLGTVRTPARASTDGKISWIGGTLLGCGPPGEYLQYMVQNVSPWATRSMHGTTIAWTD